MKSPIRHLTITYVLSFSFIALLSILIYVKLEKIISLQVSNTEIINVSGQQRMLSQRTSLYVYDFIVTGSKTSRAFAAEALTLMLANHKSLLAPHVNALALGELSPLSNELQVMYFARPVAIKVKMNAYEAALMKIIGVDANAVLDLSKINGDYALLNSTREPLLAALSTAVKQYEVESTQQIMSLRFYLTLSTIVVILALVFIAIFINRPMVNRVSNYAKKIEESWKAQIQLMHGLAVSRDEVKEKNRFLNDVMNNTGQGIVVFTKELKLSAWNDTFKQIMGLEDRDYEEGMSLEHFFALNMSENVTYKISIEDYVVRLHQRIKDRLICDTFLRDRQRYGGKIIASSQRILEDGSVINTYKDVTIERREEQRIKDLALKDGLTGLANRRAFDTQMDVETLKFSQQKIPFLLAYIDLDDFKSINDTHGHNAGDAVLKFVAETINEHIRNDDVAVRLGGDEFAVIFGGTTNRVFAEERLELVINSIKNKNKLGIFEINIGASAGLTCCPDDSEKAQDLMKLADEALYLAKKKGKGQVCLASRKAFFELA
jgi:diguanylate cyclase (GGDEF)-like protein